MAGFPSDDTLVLPQYLPPILYRKLVATLTENNNWKKIADRFVQIGILSDAEVQVMKQKPEPGELLLNEMGCRLCDVGTLCALLEECQLYNALLLFRPHVHPIITEQPFGNGDDNSLMIRRNETLHLCCRATGLPPPTYQWYSDGEPLIGFTNQELILQNFGLENEGEYYCMVVQDGYESVTSYVVSVTLSPEHPVIEQQSRRQFFCRMGAALVISVRARGHPKLSYQWFKDKRQLDGFNQPDLPLDVVTNIDEGDYRCYVYNSAGEVWSNPCNVTVFVSPEDLSELTPRPIASAKVALLIANQDYLNMSVLSTPVEDVKTLAEILTFHDFQVLALQNLTLVEMRNAIKELCKILPENAYVVFYFAGHGFEMKDKYMLPVTAPEPGSYLKKDTVSEGELLRDVLNTKPQVFLELLDMCLKSPDVENKAIFQEGLVIHEYAANNNLIQGYSTTSYLSAYERKKDKNGLYMKFLKQYLPQDISMVTILASVAKDMEKECVKQIPYRGTNVIREFRLTDPCEPADEVRRQVEALNKVPDIQVVRFDKSGVESLVTCSPYLGVYCNALQVVFTNLQGFNVTKDTKEQPLQFIIDRQGKDLAITILNIQRMRTSEVLYIHREPVKGKDSDLAQWSLEKIMIAVADLWQEELSVGLEESLERIL